MIHLAEGLKTKLEEKAMRSTMLVTTSRREDPTLLEQVQVLQLAMVQVRLR